MKHFVKSAIVAAAALLAACSTDNIVTDNEPKISIKIHAGFPQTRTAFGDKNEDTNSYPVFWDDNDSFAIVEHIAGVESQVVQAFAEEISDDRKSAEIFAELSMKRGSSFDYYAYYPYEAYSEGKMIIPAAQTPSAASVDPSAMLLFASKEGLTAQTPELDLSFGHIAAYARMTVYGLSGENDDIVSVTFSADTDLAGTVDVESGTVTNGSKNVTLDVSSLGYTTADKFDIWFTAAPQEEIKTFSVNIATQKGNYTKDFTVSGDKPLAFKQGVVSNFTVNMSGSGIKYTSIYVEKKGTLEQVIADYDYENMEAVKISGVLNDVDFLFIYRMMPNLRDLDISDVEITSLPAKAFYQSTNVENLILPNTLTAIGEWMFYYSNLKSVFIPKSVETIEKMAFYACKSLTYVTFEKGSQLKTIGGWSSYDYFGAFAGCISLTSIEIPASVETIEAMAFYNCSKLETVTFEKGSMLKTIGGGCGSTTYSYYGAFSNCSSLTSIEIPASVEIIEPAAFYNCPKLETVTFEKGSMLKTIGGRRSSYDYKSYFGAFSNSPITSIEIPASVETIERSAFQGCSKLGTVTFEKDSMLKTIEIDAFSNCSSLTSIGIPASVETIDAAFYDCSKLATVTFEKGSQLKTIGSFSGCPITSIEIPASVETIGTAAFSGCSKLATVTFEKGSQLKTIEGSSSYSYGTFSDCSSLTSIEIPASVETIETSAFYGCTKLATVTFEKGSQLKTIGGGYYKPYYCGAFYNSGLITVDISECTQVESIGDYAFYVGTLSLFKIGTAVPPTCTSLAFNPTGNSVLKVPSGSVDAYKNAYGWNKFASITGLDE